MLLKPGNFYECHLYYCRLSINSGNKKLNCFRNKMQILKMSFSATVMPFGKCVDI